MNKINRLLLLAVALCAGLSMLLAAEKKVETGPKGGRILDMTSPKAEFYVEKDRTVTITFHDEKQNPLPPGDQTVTVIADSKDGKTKLEFEKKGDALVSKTKLPEGDGYNLVVQFRLADEDILQTDAFGHYRIAPEPEQAKQRSISLAPSVAKILASSDTVFDLTDIFADIPKDNIADLY